MKRVQLLEWDGTVDSYNKIVDVCFPSDLYQVDFVDENFDLTNKITKTFRVFFMDNTYPRNIERATKEYELNGRNYNGTYFQAPCYVTSPICEIVEKSSES